MRTAQCYCGREVLYDATVGVEKWVHWVEPIGHRAEPLISKETRCPKCGHAFVVFVERPAPVAS